MKQLVRTNCVDNTLINSPFLITRILDDSLTESDEDEDAFRLIQNPSIGKPSAPGSSERQPQAVSYISTKTEKTQAAIDSDTEYSDDDDDFDVFVSTKTNAICPFLK